MIYIPDLCLLHISVVEINTHDLIYIKDQLTKRLACARNLSLSL